MSSETRSQSQNRKRNRQPQFDLNRTILHSLPKSRKTDTERENMSNPPEASRNQFIDLSQTINTGVQAVNVNGSRNDSVGNNPDNITPEVRGMVVDEALVVQRSLEEKVRSMVQEEMNDVRKSLADLTKCVMDLTKVTSQSQNVAGANPNLPNLFTIGRTAQSEGGVNTRFMFENNSESNNPLNIGNITIPYHRNYENYPSRQSIEQARIRVDKLGINFDGNSAHLSIDDFVFRLEHLQTHYQIPWAEVLRDFHLLVSGTAREWYWLYVKTHRVVDWSGLRHALMGQYRTYRSNFEIMTDLVERKQQIGESVDNYFHAMCQIRSRLVQSIPEYDLIKIIKRNIKTCKRTK